MSGPTETTDKMFPPPEQPNPGAPIPLGPSLRVEFLTHRKHMDAEMTKVRLEVTAALRTLAAGGVTPATAGARVLGGAAKAGKYGGIILGVLSLLQLLLKAKHPELAGPLEDLQKLFE